MKAVTDKCRHLGCPERPVVRVRWLDSGPGYTPPAYKSDTFCAPHGEKFANAMGGRTLVPMNDFT